MRELQRKLDHDNKLKEFFAVKSNHRVNVELEAREANRKQLQQEMADKQITNLQDIMSQIQVIFTSVSMNYNHNTIFVFCIASKCQNFE